MLGCRPLSICQTKEDLINTQVTNEYFRILLSWNDTIVTLKGSIDYYSHVDWTDSMDIWDERGQIFIDCIKLHMKLRKKAQLLCLRVANNTCHTCTMTTPWTSSENMSKCTEFTPSFYFTHLIWHIGLLWFQKNMKTDFMTVLYRGEHHRHKLCTICVGYPAWKLYEHSDVFCNS